MRSRARRGRRTQQFAWIAHLRRDRSDIGPILAKLSWSFKPDPMHPFRALFCLIPLLLAACAGPNADFAPEPIDVAPNKTYVNERSGFRFPPQVASFTRVSITNQTADESDVGVRYNDATNRIVMVVYVYPVPPGLDGDFKRNFEACKSEMAIKRGNCQMLSEEEVYVTSGGTPHPGVHATYAFSDTFDGSYQPLRSELYLFMVSHWLIKYRVTYPDSQTAVAVPVIATFMNTLVWP